MRFFFNFFSVGNRGVDFDFCETREIDWWESTISLQKFEYTCFATRTCVQSLQSITDPHILGHFSTACFFDINISDKQSIIHCCVEKVTWKSTGDRPRENSEQCSQDDSHSLYGDCCCVGPRAHSPPWVWRQTLDLNNRGWLTASGCVHVRLSWERVISVLKKGAFDRMKCWNVPEWVHR